MLHKLVDDFFSFFFCLLTSKLSWPVDRFSPISSGTIDLLFSRTPISQHFQHQYSHHIIEYYWLWWVIDWDTKLSTRMEAGRLVAKKKSWQLSVRTWTWILKIISLESGLRQETRYPCSSAVFYQRKSPRGAALGNGTVFLMYWPMPLLTLIQKSLFWVVMKIYESWSNEPPDCSNKPACICRNVDV